MIRRLLGKLFHKTHNLVEANQLYRDLAQDENVYLRLPPGVRYQLRVWRDGQLMGGQNGRCVLAVRKHRLDIYPQENPRSVRGLRFPLDGLAWFHRSRVYLDNRQVALPEMLFHFHDDELMSWFWLKIEARNPRIERLNTVIKSLAPIYARPHAFTPFDTVQATPATQDLQGGWLLAKSKVKLGLSPYALMIWDDEGIHYLPMRDVVSVETLRRMDSSFGHGLVRCQHAEQTLAFAMPHAEEFGVTLAEMAGVELKWAKDRKLKK